MQLECGNQKCQHEWNYSGTQIFYTNCPKCMRKVKLNWSKEAFDLLTEFGKEEKRKRKELEEMQSEKGVDNNRDA